MIKIRDLTFEYFDRDDEGNLTEMVNAIRGINFDAGEGEFIVVAGVNGSGKSTFAKILNRLLLPIEGTVLIGGLDAMQEENIIPIRKMVGMVFQNPDDQLIGSVVEEDVAFGAENISVPHKELVKRVEDALAQVWLAASMRIEELSGGGKQKLRRMAVSSPIGWLNVMGTDVQVADGTVGPVAQKLYDTLYGMQTGTVADDMGWTYRLL